MLTASVWRVLRSGRFFSSGHVLSLIREEMSSLKVDWRVFFMGRGPEGVETTRHEGGREAERSGRIRRSSTLATGLRRDIGRYEGPSSMGLAGL